jgi:hypothetical protein
MAKPMTFHLSAFDDMNTTTSCNINLWVNHNPQLRPEVIAGLWEADRQAIPHDRILSSIVVTHMEAFHPAFAQANHFEVEDHFDTAQSYVDWALAFAAKHGINTLLPSRFSKVIIDSKQAFEAIGVTVLHVCDGQELAVAENRPALYRLLVEHGEGAWVPAHAIWKDDYSVRLTEVVEGLKENAGASALQNAFCVMPATGQISERLFKFVDQVDPWHRLEAPSERVITVGDFGQMAHSHALKLKMNKEWVVMKHMPHVTFTVDCLAWNGDLLTNVSRVRDTQGRAGHLVVNNALLQSHVKCIAGLFKMSGVFSVKFLKDSDGSLKVLNVETGLPVNIQMSAIAGVAMPWLWLKLHATQGFYRHSPIAVTGLRVAQEIQSVVHMSDPR